MFKKKPPTLFKVLEEQLYAAQINHLATLSDVEQKKVALATSEATLSTSSDRVARLEKALKNENAIQPLAPCPGT